MSTTDIKAILEAWAKSEGLIHESHGVMAVSSTYDISRKAFYAGYQAATEAAKATGTAGEQEPWQALDFGNVPFPGHWVTSWPVAQQRGYIDGYRAAVKAEAARQPAPVVAVKIWQERVPGLTTGDVTAMQIHDAKDAEIADLRSALAATAAPVVAVLSESDIHAIIDNLPETAFEPTIAIGEITALFDDDNGEDVEVLESIKAYAKIVAFSAILAATNRSQP